MTELINKTIRNYIRKHHPDLLEMHYPVLARITAVHDEGQRVDVQVLDAEGRDDATMPVIPSIKYPSKKVIEKVVLVNGSDISVTNETVSLPEYFEVQAQDIPQVGDLVRVGFYYNDSSQPYIDGPA